MLSTSSDITTCTQSVVVTCVVSGANTNTEDLVFDVWSFKGSCLCGCYENKNCFCAGTCPIGSSVSEHGVWPTVRTYGHWPQDRKWSGTPGTGGWNILTNENICAVNGTVHE